MGNLGKRKSLAYPNPSLLLYKVKEEGWHLERVSYFRGLIRTLGLWEEFTDEHFASSSEQVYRKFLNRKRPNEKL